MIWGLIVNKKELIAKTWKSVKNDGPISTAHKVRKYLSYQKNLKTRAPIQNEYLDVLFINGCYLPHPSRYRVDHQMEELTMAGLSCESIFYTEADETYARCARVYILFRCPITDGLRKLVGKAKAYHKTVLYDIDDLVIDRKYTDNIPFIQTLSPEDKKSYDDGVVRNGEMLRLCDAAITTTEGMAEELRHYVSDVYINRNVMSEDLQKYSSAALRANVNKEPDDLIRLGYFSGSITHNVDIEMILAPLCRVLKENKQVRLVLAGEIDLPDPLKRYQDQIESLKFRDWKELPELIASVDINLVPLQDTIFNRAKSENKWLEASLVKVPTIASRVGAFQMMIHDCKDGILCENTEEDWYQKISGLIQNADYRRELAENAYQRVIRECTTITQAYSFGHFIRSIRRPNVVFNLPVLQISGGQLVTLRHALFLFQSGFEIVILNDGHEEDLTIQFENTEFPVIRSMDHSFQAEVDKAVATLFTTEEWAAGYPRARERFYLVQNYEIGFNAPGDSMRIRASQSYCDFRVRYLTISSWCKNWLQKNYHSCAEYAPNGLDTEKFYYQERDFSGKIRILIEGNSDDDYKNVDESFRIIKDLDPARFEIWYVSYQGKPKDWYHVDQFYNRVPYNQMPDLYRKCHVLLKSSRLESFSYPPLEMMATGGLVLARANEGNQEYLRDHYNCLFYDPNHLDEAADLLKIMIKDENLRQKLINNGIETARSRDWNKIKNQILQLYVS